MNSAIKKIAYKITLRNSFVYRLCKRYVDFFRNENNQNIIVNGELNLMRRVLPDCNIVFDVGANVGRWTTLALNINSNLNIHCFEPSRITYEKLMKQNFPPQVKCNNSGLGSQEEERKLYIFKEGATINSLYKRRGLESVGLETQRQEENIRLETLDGYCRKTGIEKIDYLKIDVEGHELEVFKGALQMLKNNQIGIIQFEYGGANIDAKVLLKDLFEFFQNYNYTLYKIYPKGLHRKSRYDQQLENFQYQNWAAVNKKSSFCFME